MTVDRAWIAAHIPHAGTMCLLDRILEWDGSNIRCEATSHRAVDNPLRSNDCLHAASGIEYAAQAMAVHGALCNAGAGRPRAGFLASVRSVELAVDRLDDIADSLIVAAERLGGDGGSVLYGFVVSSQGMRLLAGRAAVILDGTARVTQSAAPARPGAT
jgi:predicted hotdog family 3-hydroxylacyl-ACP dehydratase